MNLDWPNITKSLTRREWMQMLLGLAAWLPAPVLLAAANSPKKRSLDSLGPFLDTLLPGNGRASATELGVGASIISQANGNKGLQRLLIAGCAWLDQEAQKSAGLTFAGLDQDQCIAIVSRAEQSKARTLPRVFFSSIRDLAFQYYYAHPESWKHLTYSGPPQPQGFPGHNSPLGSRQ